MGSGTPIKNIQFFMDKDVSSWMFRNNPGVTEYGKSFQDGDDFCYDVIDQAWHFEVKSDQSETRAKLYFRGDSGVYMEEFADVSVVFYKYGGEPSVTTSGKLVGNLSDLMNVFFNVSQYLQIEAERQGLMDDLWDYDPSNEGIMVEVINEEVVFTRVAGKKRPDLLCRSLFGGEQMMRPYVNEVADDLLSFFGTSMMSFEDQLKAAEDGNESAMDAVASAYLNGDEDEGIEVDPEKAWYWYEKLAEQGSSMAAYNLGLLSAYGVGVERNFKEAAKWMDTAVEYGDDDGIEMAKKYRQVQEDLDKAEGGDAKAQGRLAKFYMTAAHQFVESLDDGYYEESAKWAKCAAEQKDGLGAWILALAYDHGRGVRKDRKKATEYYTIGAKAGYVESINSLGNCYLKGEGVTANNRMGYELLLRSALLGDSLAQENLGLCYQKGYGCMMNLAKATAWYRKAAEATGDGELMKKALVWEDAISVDPEMAEDCEGERIEKLTREQEEMLAEIDEALGENFKKILENPDRPIEDLLRQYREM